MKKIRSTFPFYNIFIFICSGYVYSYGHIVHFKLVSRGGIFVYLYLFYPANLKATTRIGDKFLKICTMYFRKTHPLKSVHILYFLIQTPNSANYQYLASDSFGLEAQSRMEKKVDCRGYTKRGHLQQIHEPLK